jgi:hypothetical protein
MPRSEPQLRIRSSGRTPGEIDHVSQLVKGGAPLHVYKFNIKIPAGSSFVIDANGTYRYGLSESTAPTYQFVYEGPENKFRLESVT